MTALRTIYIFRCTRVLFSRDMEIMTRLFFSNVWPRIHCVWNKSLARERICGRIRAEETDENCAAINSLRGYDLLATSSGRVPLLPYANRHWLPGEVPEKWVRARSNGRAIRGVRLFLSRQFITVNSEEREEVAWCFSRGNAGGGRYRALL